MEVEQLSSTLHVRRLKISTDSEMIDPSKATALGIASAYMLFVFLWCFTMVTKHLNLFEKLGPQLTAAVHHRPLLPIRNGDLASRSSSSRLRLLHLWLVIS